MGEPLIFKIKFRIRKSCIKNQKSNPVGFDDFFIV